MFRYIRRNLKSHIFIEYPNNIYFYGDINCANILKLTSYVRLLNKKKLQCINIHMASDGGELEYGFLGYDLLKKNHIRINTYCEGSVISAGTLIYLSGYNRYITPNSSILIHQLSHKCDGTYNNMIDSLYNTTIMMTKLQNIYNLETNMSIEFINEIMKRDIFLTSYQCVQYGICNNIISD